MNLKIRDILDAGALDNERLVINVLQDDDVGYFLVLDTTSVSEGTVSAKPKHTYWFPDKQVKIGDLVVLYTKKGTQSATQNKDGSTSHFFYWGFDNALWTKPDDAVLLLESRAWAVKRMK